MTHVLSILHGHGDMLSALARGFASSIGWMVARSLGWPLASGVLFLGGLVYWWRKRRATRRQRRGFADDGTSVYSSEYGTHRVDYESGQGSGRGNGGS